MLGCYAHINTSYITLKCKYHVPCMHDYHYLCSLAAGGYVTLFSFSYTSMQTMYKACVENEKAWYYMELSYISGRFFAYSVIYEDGNSVGTSEQGSQHLHTNFEIEFYSIIYVCNTN